MKKFLIIFLAAILLLSSCVKSAEQVTVTTPVTDEHLNSPEATSTPFQESTPVPVTPSSTPTLTPTSKPVPATPSSTPAPTPTSTPVPATPSSTPAPTPTSTPVPATPSSTPAPTPTSTPVPATPSNTPAPTPTSTPVPVTPSSTPVPPVESSVAKKLFLANGLFSIEVKNLEDNNKNLRDLQSDEFYVIEDYLTIRANYAPIKKYNETAHVKFNSLVSYYYAFSFNNSYSESEAKEETLSNGDKITWQIMRDDNSKAIICEIINKQFGYNFVIFSSGNKITEDELIDMIHSVEYDSELESRIINQVQILKDGDIYVGIDNSMQLKTNSGWEISTAIIKPNSVFALEFMHGLLLIDMIRLDDIVLKDEVKSAFDFYMAELKSSIKNSDAKWGETEEIVFKNLSDSKAYCAEVYTGGSNPIYIKQVCILYKGYFYLGRFMWIKNMDTFMRSSMEGIIKSLSDVDME